MAMPLIPKALYPLVPSAPGVPAMLRSAGAILDTLTFGKLGIGDAINSFIGSGGPRWGLYDAAGNAAIIADSVESFSYEGSSRVSNYPIEGGKFSSYNKVADPYDVVIRLTCGGSTDDRTGFLSACETAANSLTLYTVVTPETVYSNANVVSYSYRRDANNGANRIIAELHIVEVRQVAASEFANTKDPTSGREISLGQIQPVGDVSFDPSEFA